MKPGIEGAVLALALALAVTLAIAGTARAATKTPPRSMLHGAIALERKSEAIGYAVHQKSSYEARVEALRQCGQPGCEVVLRIEGDCGAVARPAASRDHYAKFSTATGTTRAEAETKALRNCGKGCEVAVWACNR